MNCIPAGELCNPHHDRHLAEVDRQFITVQARRVVLELCHHSPWMVLADCREEGRVAKSALCEVDILQRDKPHVPATILKRALQHLRLWFQKVGLAVVALLLSDFDPIGWHGSLSGVPQRSCLVMLLAL